MYASKGHYSPEIDLLHKIDRFGIEAITGRRQFYFGELRRLILAENIARSYIERSHSESWAAWANKNPIMAGILAEIEKTVT